MADTDLRELERKAAGGDAEAAEALGRARCRLGEHEWAVVERPRLAARCRRCDTLGAVDAWLQQQLGAEAVRRWGPAAATAKWERVLAPPGNGYLELDCRCDVPDAPLVFTGGVSARTILLHRVTLLPATFACWSGAGARPREWSAAMGRCGGCGKVHVAADPVTVRQRLGRNSLRSRPLSRENGRAGGAG